ncbi:siderophore ABC transporter substrate-binding protein [Paracoccus aestuarii]|uniref:Siderophore ABC transporter substrate-binding protein n=1 Tax=Paracoccus aestuarii TaxID=453842 RepID=A0A418ZSE0_9RHOB|nr:siderophore ABC transporter substrate-binding protein [Paracoccus aestuarii]RJK98997.1 siderophore ABC transporter substrate-binding protein [Paracoccus aestuarii]WCQ99466.1 siderophore ABC transporter substrate-binding protein [Paracoccus aestuarii]
MLKPLLPLVLATTLATPALAQPLSIPTAQGPVTVEANPATIAVYDMAALDTLLALGVMPAATIDPIQVPELARAARSARPVGTLFEPDLEALAALAPDLVIVGGRSSVQLGAVSNVAPAIDMTLGADLLADARLRIDGYGALFGREDEARALNAALDDRLERLRDAAQGKGDMLIVMTNGTRMSAYGAQSRFGWIFDATGLEEAVPGLDNANHGQAISHEFIAQADPDWLVVVDRAAAIGETAPDALQTLRSDLVAGTTAWRQDQVVVLDPGQTYISAGGYSALEGTLDRLIAAFSGDAPA